MSASPLARLAPRHVGKWPPSKVTSQCVSLRCHFSRSDLDACERCSFAFPGLVRLLVGAFVRSLPWIVFGGFLTH